MTGLLSNALNVRFTIPIGIDDNDRSHIDFSKWVPKDNSFCLSKTTENLRLEIWLDYSCIADFADKSEESINKCLNNPICKLYVDVFFSDLSTQFIEFINAKREKKITDDNFESLYDDKTYGELKQTYIDLGMEAIHEAIIAYNQVIAYCRNYKGQYWLQERVYDPGKMSSMSLQFNSMARINEGDWFRWYPNAPTKLTLFVQSNDLAITQSDWSSIQDFLSANSRPDFVLELLANSQSYISEGYRRSAIVESITALEIAVNQFAKSPNTSLILKDEQTSRINISNLHNQVKHFGFSGTVDYLLPHLLTKKLLSTDILTKCQKAISVRQNIIHNGQRDILELEVRQLVSAVREMCRILIDLTI